MSNNPGPPSANGYNGRGGLGDNLQGCALLLLFFIGFGSCLSCGNGGFILFVISVLLTCCVVASEEFATWLLLTVPVYFMVPPLHRIAVNAGLPKIAADPGALLLFGSLLLAPAFLTIWSRGHHYLIIRMLSESTFWRSLRVHVLCQSFIGDLRDLCVEVLERGTAYLLCASPVAFLFIVACYSPLGAAAGVCCAVSVGFFFAGQEPTHRFCDRVAGLGITIISFAVGIIGLILGGFAIFDWWT